MGKIVKMGPGTENAAVKVGDRVGVKWISAICDSCRMFPSSYPNSSGIQCNANHFLETPQLLAFPAMMEPASTRYIFSTT